MKTKRRINLFVWFALALACDVATIIRWSSIPDCPTTSIVVACLFYTLCSAALCWSIDEAIKENNNPSGGSLKA